jgi:hypothetical protein
MRASALAVSVAPEGMSAERTSPPVRERRVGRDRGRVGGEERELGRELRERRHAVRVVPESRDPRQLGRRHAEVELVAGAERPRDLLGQHLGDALAGRPAHDLADQEAVCLGLVADPLPRLPPRLGLGERAAHRVPVT